MKRSIPSGAFAVLLLLVSQSGEASRKPVTEILPLIEDLDGAIQERLLQPLPDALGMSRIMLPVSFGRHFLPVVTEKRDFAPETERERKVIAALEQRRVEVGLYLFGASILSEEAQTHSFRALKGPGAMTAGTPRPRRYPVDLEILANPFTVGNNRLPDWFAIYPIAQRAMRSFQDGGKGFEMQLESWTIAARPAIAAQERCVSCHNNPAYRPHEGFKEVKLGAPIGGILYAYRLPKTI